jgi:hypothetical protein
MVPAARKIAEWAGSLIKTLNEATLDSARTLRLLHRLAETARATVTDHDSARQVEWSFHTIYNETFPTGQRDPVIEHALAELETELSLNPSAGGEPLPIEKTLSNRLKPIADFRPESFQSRFAIIAERLARVPAAAPPER